MLGRRAIRAFGQSKQAVKESASLLEVIVCGLTSRIQTSESVATKVRADLDKIMTQGAEVASEQRQLRARYAQLLNHVQQTMANDQKLVDELQQLKSKYAFVHERNGSRPLKPSPSDPQENVQMPDRNALGSLTPTELQAIEILAREGPKAAPELGQRLKKSREHMARLMKKLYFEGYVDRESNRTPFKYRLNDKVHPSLASVAESITSKVTDST